MEPVEINTTAYCEHITTMFTHNNQIENGLCHQIPTVASKYSYYTLTLG